jgi:hypothetical protein
MSLIFLILIWVNILYNISGLYYVILFLLSIKIFIVSTVNLLQDPNNFILRSTQVISLITIIYIIYLNIYFLFLVYF